MPMTPTTRQICALKFGGRPCIAIPRADMTTVTYDCVEWCPLLRRLIDPVDDPHIEWREEREEET